MHGIESFWVLLPGAKSVLDIEDHQPAMFKSFCRPEKVCLRHCAPGYCINQDLQISGTFLDTVPPVT